MLILLTGIVFLIFPSCQKDELSNGLMEEDISGLNKARTLEASSPIIYYGPETFTIASREVDETRILNNDQFSNYENFVLRVQNGINGKTKVTRMEISIDGKTMVTFSDFRKNANIVTKAIPDLKSNSILHVKLHGSKGRFVRIQIECSSKTGQVTDVEGHTYKTVYICGRWWMAENLRTTKLNDGTSIDEAADNQAWITHYSDRIPAYCWYDNNSANGSTYGALYNWVVGSNVCPEGWRIPDSNEFFDLSLCIDPDSHQSTGTFSEIAGGALKEVGTAHWLSPNTGATNSTGFTGLPNGQRNNDGDYSALGTMGSWWADDGLSFLAVDNTTTNLYFTEGGNEHGRAIRCIKDQ